MNLIAAFDIFAVIFLFLAFCVLISVNKEKISTSSKAFLYLAILVFLLIQSSNVLEHTEITDTFDKYEDFLELLIIPFFLAFLFDDFNWNKSLKLLNAEQKARNSEKRFRDLTENLNDIIWEVDENDFYTYASPNLTKYLGYELDEFVGKNIYDFMPDKEKEKVREGYTKIKNLRQGFSNLENLNKVKNKKRYKLFEASGVPIFDKGGEFRGYRGISRDITERKKQEKEKEKLLKKLQKALDEIKTLQGILPICSYCKNVRDDKGAWHKIDSYIQEHSDADFSHGICPECYKDNFPEFEKMGNT